MNDEQMMTREAILDWLKRQPETRTMGSESRYSYDCVGACYLNDRGYPNAQVGTRYYWLDGSRFEVGIPLSPDVLGLVNTFDDIPGYDHTPSEVLRAIEEEESNQAR